MSTSLDADPDAEALAGVLLDDTATQKAILRETATSAGSGMTLESGRTVCDIDGEPQEPLDRHQDAVDLRPCSPGTTTGIYHTHPHPTQMRNPDHSLPDMANVVFGAVDASVVTGTESASVLVAAADREAMVEQFRNAVGLDVGSTREVVEAITAGRVPDPDGVRERVRAALDPLFERVPTSFEIEVAASSGAVVAASTINQPAAECARVDPATTAEDVRQELRGCGSLRRQGRVGGRKLIGALSEAGATDIVVGTLIGNVVSTGVDRVLFE